MQYQRFGDRYIVRLESGENVMETLTELLRTEGVQFAHISAIGAVRWAQIACWNAGTREYDYQDFEEQMEVVSLQGNCALKDGEPFLHIHCALSKQDFSVVGGHLKEAQVRPTLEVWLRIEQSPVHRTPDPESGLNLLDLRTVT